MDIGRFEAGYPDLPEKVVPSNADRRELLAEPRKWTGFFETQLSNYMRGGDLDWQEIQTILPEYIQWSVLHADSAAKELNKLHDPTSIGSASSELEFHRLNRFMLPAWLRLALPDTELPAEELTQIQLLAAVEEAPAIKDFHGLNSKDPASLEKVKKGLGHLNEVDAMIVSLELMKRHPELVILPAPGKFLHNKPAKLEGTGSRNSNFIALDTERREARGIQVQTSSSTFSKVSRYDSDFVTVIDGHVDFGNTTFKERGVASLPGQLALSLLAERPINEPLYPGPKSHYMRSRAIAREVMRNRRNYLPTATSHVEERLFNDLYKDTESENKKDTA